VDWAGQAAGPDRQAEDLPGDHVEPLGDVVDARPAVGHGGRLESGPQVRQAGQGADVVDLPLAELAGRDGRAPVCVAVTDLSLVVGYVLAIGSTLVVWVPMLVLYGLYR
jgi:hypothetical protein